MSPSSPELAPHPYLADTWVPVFHIPYVRHIPEYQFINTLASHPADDELPPPAQTIEQVAPVEQNQISLTEADTSPDFAEFSNTNSRDCDSGEFVPSSSFNSAGGNPLAPQYTVPDPTSAPPFADYLLEPSLFTAYAQLDNNNVQPGIDDLLNSDYNRLTTPSNNDTVDYGAALSLEAALANAAFGNIPVSQFDDMQQHSFAHNGIDRIHDQVANSHDAAYPPLTEQTTTFTPQSAHTTTYHYGNSTPVAPQTTTYTYNNPNADSVPAGSSSNQVFNSVEYVNPRELSNSYVRNAVPQSYYTENDRQYEQQDPNRHAHGRNQQRMAIEGNNMASTYPNFRLVNARRYHSNGSISEIILVRRIDNLGIQKTFFENEETQELVFEAGQHWKTLDEWRGVLRNGGIEMDGNARKDLGIDKFELCRELNDLLADRIGVERIVAATEESFVESLEGYMGPDFF